MTTVFISKYPDRGVIEATLISILPSQAREVKWPAIGRACFAPEYVHETRAEALIAIAEEFEKRSGELKLEAQALEMRAVGLYREGWDLQRMETEKTA